MSLRDWIDELCGVLELDAEIDEGLVLDLARVVAHAVQRPAAPVSAYVLGLAVGARGGDPATAELLAARAEELAERWERTAATEPLEGPEAPDRADEA